jgi:DNA-binding ferritin-like protein
MNLFGATTKTIKTYGKKNSERVVNINAWNYEVDEKLGEIGSSPINEINDTAKKNSVKKDVSKSQTNKDVINKNAEKKPAKRYTKTKQRKTFTKGFTKSKYYLSPPKVINHTKETSHNMESVSPKWSISSKTMVIEKTPSPIKSNRMPLTPKQLKKNYHSQTKDHDLCNEPLGKVIISPLKELNTLPSSHSILLNYEKENIYNSHNDRLETRSSFSDVKHLEIDKLTKEHEQITDELAELLNICDQKKLWSFEEFLGIEWVESSLI